MVSPGRVAPRTIRQLDGSPPRRFATRMLGGGESGNYAD